MGFNQDSTLINSIKHFTQHRIPEPFTHHKYLFVCTNDAVPPSFFMFNKKNVASICKGRTVDIQFFKPHPLLQEWIQCIMIVNYQIHNHHANEVCTYPPTPQPSLFFYIGDKIKVRKWGSDNFEEQPNSVIVGQQLNSVSIDINRHHRAVRVGFHPGGLYRLIGVPMHELIDGHYDAEEVFGKQMKTVNEKLHLAHHNLEIKNIIEMFLLSQLDRMKPLLPFDMAMLELFKENPSTSIEQIASLACLSVRQFERVSRQRIGLPPKLFARIIRFSKAYRMREEYTKLSWTDIAHRCGYFDQMHFIRDFKAFAGTTPKQVEKMLEEQPVKMQIGLRL